MLWNFQWLHRVGPCSSKVSRRPDWFWWSPPRILIYIPVLHDLVSIWLYSATWSYIIELSVASGTWLGEKPHWCFAKVSTRTHCISGECWADVSLSLSRPFLLSSIKMSLVTIRRLFLRAMLTIKCQWPYLGYIVTLLHQPRPQENKWPHCKMKNENDRSRRSRFQTSYVTSSCPSTNIEQILRYDHP